MTQDEVVVCLKMLLVERLRLSPDRIQPLELDSPLLRDGLGLDSLDCIELLLGIEDEFSLAFDDSEDTIFVWEIVDDDNLPEITILVFPGLALSDCFTAGPLAFMASAWLIHILDPASC